LRPSDALNRGKPLERAGTAGPLGGVDRVVLVGVEDVGQALAVAVLVELLGIGEGRGDPQFAEGAPAAGVARGVQEGVGGQAAAFVGALHGGDVDVGLDPVAGEEEVGDAGPGGGPLFPGSGGLDEQRLVVGDVRGAGAGDGGVEVPVVEHVVGE